MKRREDAEQLELFRRGKPVDHVWFQKWISDQLKRQIDETVLEGAELWEALNRVDLPRVPKDLHNAILNFQSALAEFQHLRPKHVPDERSVPCDVPRWGEIALLFLAPKKDRETRLGDLEEEFRTHIVPKMRRLVPKMSRLLAHAWYWKEVLLLVPWLWLVLFYKLLTAKIGVPM